MRDGARDERETSPHAAPVRSRDGAASALRLVDTARPFSNAHAGCRPTAAAAPACTGRETSPTLVCGAVGEAGARREGRRRRHASGAGGGRGETAGTKRCAPCPDSLRRRCSRAGRGLMRHTPGGAEMRERFKRAAVAAGGGGGGGAAPHVVGRGRANIVVAEGAALAGGDALARGACRGDRMARGGCAERSAGGMEGEGALEVRCSADLSAQGVGVAARARVVSPGIPRSRDGAPEEERSTRKTVPWDLCGELRCVLQMEGRWNAAENSAAGIGATRLRNWCSEHCEMALRDVAGVLCHPMRSTLNYFERGAERARARSSRESMRCAGGVAGRAQPLDSRAVLKPSDVFPVPWPEAPRIAAAVDDTRPAGPVFGASVFPPGHAAPEAGGRAAATGESAARGRRPFPEHAAAGAVPTGIFEIFRKSLTPDAGAGRRRRRPVPARKIFSRERRPTSPRRLRGRGGRRGRLGGVSATLAAAAAPAPPADGGRPAGRRPRGRFSRHVSRLPALRRASSPPRAIFPGDVPAARFAGFRALPARCCFRLPPLPRAAAAGRGGAGGRSGPCAGARGAGMSRGCGAACSPRRAVGASYKARLPRGWAAPSPGNARPLLSGRGGPLPCLPR